VQNKASTAGNGLSRTAAKKQQVRIKKMKKNFNMPTLFVKKNENSRFFFAVFWKISKSVTKAFYF
jgi:hypothetical protein